MPACFLTKTEKVVDLNGRGGGKELGGVGGGETVVRTYYIKKSISKKRKKIKRNLTYYLNILFVPCSFLINNYFTF